MARKHYDLKDKAVLITGAARGIGAESARQMAKKGARVSLVGLEPEELEKVGAECGNGAVWFEADVTDRESLQRAIDGTVEQLGGIDVCMANAGIAAGGLVHLMDPGAIDAVLRINLEGAARTLRLCLPHVIERRGYLIPVASAAAIAHTPGIAAYSATKAGIEAFANALRMEVRHKGVDVGVAYFAFIDTDMVRGTDEHEHFRQLREDQRGVLRKTYPVSAAGRAVAKGVERRARWVCVPGWLKAMIVFRGPLMNLIEGQAAKQMPDFERIALKEIEEIGIERSSAPVGAGGRAAETSVKT